MTWPLDLAHGLRQALGSAGARVTRDLLASALDHGEGGALFLAVEADVRLVGAHPTEEPFQQAPVVAFARQASRSPAAAALVPDAPLTPEWPEAVAFPVGSAEETRGVLLLLGRPGAGVSAETRARAAVLGPALAVVAELDAARRRARHAELHVNHFRQMLRLAKPGRDLDEICQQVLDLAVTLTDGDVGGLWLRERPGEDLTLRAARRVLGRRGPRPLLPPTDLDRLLGAAALCAPPFPLAVPREYLRDDAVSAAVLIPLHQDDELVGLLAVGRLDGDRPFGEPLAERLLELADVATVPIVNVCLRDDLRERNRQVRATRRIGKAISACLSLEEIFRVATQEIRRITAFDASAIVVMDAEGNGGQVMVGEVGRPPRTLPWSPEFRETVSGEAMRTGRAAIVADIATSSRPVLPFLRELPGARSLTTVPLVVERESVGALTLVSRTRGRFRRRDLRLLRPIAEQLAVAVRHARLLRATTFGLEERLRLEVRLARAERYATIGRLAAALAHEIRNPLTVIGTTVQYLRDRLPVGDEQRALLDAADRKVRDMDESLEGLLSFSRPLELRPQPARIEPILEAVAAFVRVRARQRSVEVRVEAEPGLPGLMLDARLLEQALLNLALNALDAMPHGGRLTFGATPAPRSGNVAVTVADTGTGIEGSHLGVIFEPYYTTKRRGTGLGLAITRRIIEEHGGAIEAASEPGRGTTFMVLLPAARSAPPGGGAPERSDLPEPSHGPDTPAAG